MSRLFVSTVSHNNDNMIVSNHVLPELAKKFSVVVKCNTKCSDELFSTAKSSGIHLIDSCYSVGFAKNNNIVFDFCRDNLGMKDDDLFLVLNPDVVVSAETLTRLVDGFISSRSNIATINLYKDLDYKDPEGSVKKFPGLLTPFIAFFSRKHPGEYNKVDFAGRVNVDWAAGSFLLFRAAVFKQLNGFDEKYFMYFEDVDICRRAAHAGYAIDFFSEIKATHFGAYKNRNFLSRNFAWYLRSYFRYHFGV